MRSSLRVWGVGVVGLLGVHGVALAATFYVDAVNGDDSRSAAEAQASSTPWKTLTQAITEGTVASGDTIQVAAGTYNDALGEQFPLTLLDGVVIRGAGDATVVETNGTTAFECMEDTLGSGTALRDMKVTSTAGGFGVLFSNLAGTSAPLVTNTTFGPGLSSGVVIRQSDAGTFSGSITNNVFDGGTLGIQARWEGPGNLGAVFDGNTATGTQAGAIEITRTETSNGGTVSPVITNNTISGAGTGIYLSLSSASGSSSFTPLIDGNVVSDTTYEGVYIGTYYLGGKQVVSPTVSNNTITRPDGTGIGWDLYSISSSARLEGTLTIAGNTITDGSSLGISASWSSMSAGGELDYDLLIANNTITNGGGTGISFSLSSMSSVTGRLGVTIAGNTVTGAGDVGVSISLSSLNDATFDLDVSIVGNDIRESGLDGISVWCDDDDYLGSATWEISDNLVVDGTSGAGTFDFSGTSTDERIVVQRNVFADNADGLYLENPMDLGGGALGSAGRNVFRGTVTGVDLYNESASAQKAVGNRWRTTTVAAEIDALINDDDENGTRGAVDFGGALSADPTRTASLDLTATVDGDTVTYTATATATGDLGCPTAELTGDIPAGATYTPGSIAADGDVSVALPGDAHIALGLVAPGSPVEITWEVEATGAEPCTELSATATLSCAEVGDVESAPAVAVLGATTEIPDDGIDQDCDGADLVTADTDGGSDDGTDDTTDDGTDDSDDAKKGCGCDTSSPRGTFALAGLAVLALARRRRT